MRKIVLTVLVLTTIFLIPRKIFADQIAGNSATISYNASNDNNASDLFKKKLAIKRILSKNNSPLLDSVDDFMNTCIKYDLDCFLLPSITGLESSFGRFTWPESHNPFGWGGGYIMFDTWTQAIDAVGKGLKFNYINKGATTVNLIAPIYAESPTWAERVNLFMTKFESEENNIQLFLTKNIVKL